jgi:anaerobic selenocysteine-containing dehydrogenase
LPSLSALGKGELLLIGRRLLRTNNSWSHNSLRLVKGPEQCTLLIHPRDAQARGIGDGAKVRIASRVGAIEVPAVLSDEVMPGVVSLPHGYGHNRPGTSWRIAEAHAGASINDLTDEQRIDVMAGTASFSGLPVAVAPVVTAVAT